MRNPEFEFLSTDKAEMEAWLTEQWESVSGVSVRPASPERMIIQWMASILIQDRARQNRAMDQNIPSRAEGDNLDALAELIYLPDRPESKAAACTMRFFISGPQEFSVIIPAGTRVTDTAGTLVWETTRDAYVPIGGTETEVQVRCQTAGAVGNGYTAGQINALVDIFDYYDYCANVTQSEGGADRATDDEYYELMRDSMDAYSCAGAKGSYEYFARQVSTQIADVVANSPTPGVVKIYALMEGGTLAGEEMKGAVLAACSEAEKRPLTDFVCVEDAEVVSYDINFTYYLQTGRSQSAAEIEAAVNDAMERYQAWQCAKLGRDINPDELRKYLYTTGIKRVELVSPVFTPLRDGRDKTVPQVARIGTVTVTNGGYEDE